MALRSDCKIVLTSPGPAFRSPGVCVCDKFKGNTSGPAKDKQGKLLTTEKEQKEDGQNTFGKYSISESDETANIPELLTTLI